VHFFDPTHFRLSHPRYETTCSPRGRTALLNPAGPTDEQRYDSIYGRGVLVSSRYNVHVLEHIFPLELRLENVLEVENSPHTVQLVIKAVR
jgi:hypothetical protein